MKYNNPSPPSPPKKRGNFGPGLDQCNELQLTNISCKERRLHILEELQGGIFLWWNDFNNALKCNRFSISY